MENFDSDMHVCFTCKQRNAPNIWPLPRNAPLKLACQDLSLSVIYDFLIFNDLEYHFMNLFITVYVRSDAF